VRGHSAALNATIAAAMVRMSGPTKNDRVANLMCGSGTLLIERLLAGPARSAVGVDSDPAAIAAAQENAAGLDVELHTADIADWTGGPFDVIFADPPWGDKTGSHETNDALHELLLRKAFELSATRLVVLTHEIRIMQRCLRRTDFWTVRRELRVFAKGHHPRIYVLNRRSGR
jgi:23S rRNA G2445 N2-methylase RlmL